LIVLHPISPGNAQVFKAVRLRALQESPGAFGSTYAREAQLTGDDWLTRSRRWNGDRAAGFIAINQNENQGENQGRPSDDACGLVCSFLDQQDPTRAHLVSMWTDPAYRRRGLGQRLVEAAVAWARSRGARTMMLMVTSSNASAIRFYQQLGFTRTGRTEPYPNDPNVIEYEMSRSIA